MKAKICLTETAQSIFNKLNMPINEYGTAYSDESAGLDLYNMGPKITIQGRNKWAVFGEHPVLIPTGIRAVIPNGFVGLVLERGSVVRTGLSIRAGVIDPGFIGEIFVSFLNVGERETTIESGAPIPAQLLVVPCASSFEQITYGDYEKQTIDSKRKDNMLGSTN